MSLPGGSRGFNHKRQMRATVGLRVSFRHHPSRPTPLQRRRRQRQQAGLDSRGSLTMSSPAGSRRSTLSSIAEDIEQLGECLEEVETMFERLEAMASDADPFLEVRLTPAGMFQATALLAEISGYPINISEFEL
ncbi:uncharacterized protein VTP21DRAFT_5985 [Calcarisporiella thermophila]|uniref:uncharacterized protein n=1 Tax=Calcarisporiella thermophila TaxID=911321 RepID=UPI0037437A9E